ncbi:MAG TPA: 4-(cytidine 5'-diphospho)-2-C-methyl-D-erythritol kinase [Actinomycetota bacterium]|nr:4-(cytidine 5'-diphospho)-2-C-methyl-D-erythritol kinase [Actinomycetota bacterium]
MSDGAVREPAPAKLNPFLRVMGRRPDGFHEVETLVQPITLADGVEVRVAPELGLELAGPRAHEVPRGKENLAIKAARALAEASGVRAGARVVVVKQVPVAAGLGGGSADAAAALRALNRVWALGWDDERLAEVGAPVGSDVPALIGGGPVLARGRGERIEPAAVGRTWWVLVIEPFGVAASDAYAWWDEDGEPVGPDPAPVLAALRDGAAEEAGGLLFNDLEPSVGARHPEIRAAREALVGAGAVGVVMCGSGPTMSGLCRDGRHAEEVAAAVGGLVVGSIVRPP